MQTWLVLLVPQPVIFYLSRCLLHLLERSFGPFTCGIYPSKACFSSFIRVPNLNWRKLSEELLPKSLGKCFPFVLSLNRMTLSTSNTWILDRFPLPLKHSMFQKCFLLFYTSSVNETCFVEFHCNDHFWEFCFLFLFRSPEVPFVRLEVCDLCRMISHIGSVLLLFEARELIW